MIKKIIVSIFIIIFTTTQATAGYLKDRAVQTYYFETNNEKQVMNAVINTLQDSDFIIEDVDDNLGFLRAKKYFKTRHTDKKRVAGWSGMLALATAYTVFSYGSTAASMYSPARRIVTEMKDKTVVVDTNADITKIGDNMIKVRIIFIRKVLQNADGFSFVKSTPIEVSKITDERVYNEFFEQTKNHIPF
ncbi:hypothetical protein J6G99_05525 [bacterium]|nr:hypothetical protein [bacterium]